MFLTLHNSGSAVQSTCETSERDNHDKHIKKKTFCIREITSNQQIIMPKAGTRKSVMSFRDFNKSDSLVQFYSSNTRLALDIYKTFFRCRDVNEITFKRSNG